MTESGSTKSAERRGGRERIDKSGKYIRIAAKYFDIGRERAEREKLYLARDARPPGEVLRRVIK